MPREWKGPFSRRLQARASELGRRMARRRWELDRARRNRMATLAAESSWGRIVRRIVVIDHETDVREVVILNSDSARETRRKIRDVLKTT